VMGSRQTESAFTQFDGKLVKGLTIKTVRVSPATDLRELRRCHVIFVDATADRDVVAEMVRQSKGLLTAFGPNGEEHGDPCLRLVKQADALFFDIDLKCTRRAELEVDAGLISLARRVRK
ncbi:MAG: YfiR family protein, partial [Gammaproteobacteria bacterium]|nr:YfiR family protein [Gammaproteobacteria bacterium]